MTYLINSDAKVLLFFISPNFLAKNFKKISISLILYVSKPKDRKTKAQIELFEAFQSLIYKMGGEAHNCEI